MDTKPKYSEDVTKAAQTKQELNLDVSQFRPLLSLLGWLPFNASPTTASYLQEEMGN